MGIGCNQMMALILGKQLDKGFLGDLMRRESDRFIFQQVILCVVSEDMTVKLKVPSTSNNFVH